MIYWIDMNCLLQFSPVVYNKVFVYYFILRNSKPIIFDKLYILFLDIILNKPKNFKITFNFYYTLSFLLSYITLIKLINFRKKTFKKKSYYL